MTDISSGEVTTSNVRACRQLVLIHIQHLLHLHHMGSHSCSVNRQPSHGVVDELIDDVMSRLVEVLALSFQPAVNGSTLRDIRTIQLAVIFGAQVPAGGTGSSASQVVPISKQS